MSSESRVWLITGSSQGLGRALVETVLEAGERVVATLRRPAQLAELSTKYPSSQLLVLELDVVNEAHIDHAFEETIKQFGRLDVVVNNAGYGLFGEIEVVPKDEARRELEVLFWGPAHIIKRAIPFFRNVNPAGVGGHILNISSIGGFVAQPGLGYYHAGKFALEGFTESLSKELLPEWNIKATIIEPGGFRTSWHGSSMVNIPTIPAYEKDQAPSNAFRQYVKNVPAFGDPFKAAKAILSIAGRKDLPLRIPLGTDAHVLLTSQAQNIFDDAKKPEWEELAHSTNFDEIGKEKVLEQLAASGVTN